ncbi:G-protein coupled receptor 20 [Camelus ferus]|nr:G-protein coupled receptor 20 [Camelus ferus]
MPSASPTGPSAVAAPNATVAGVMWANNSMSEMSLFHRFALLDEELHAAFPGLWLVLMAVHGVIFLAGLVLNGLALYVFSCRTRAKTPSVTYTINLVVTDLLVGLSLPTRFAVFYGARAAPSRTMFTGRILCALSRPGLLRQGRQRRVRAMQLLLTVLVIFLVCFTPFHARQVAVELWPDVPPHTSLVAYHVAVTLSSLNSCMDPIVYCFVTSSFQATVRGLFRGRGVECEPSSCDVVSMHRSSKGSGHHHILGARPRALTQTLANGPEA